MYISADDSTFVVSEIVSLFTEAFGGPPILGSCVWGQYPDLEPEYEPCVICITLNGKCPNTDTELLEVRRHHARK
jgi:hypothetical protein